MAHKICKFKNKKIHIDVFLYVKQPNKWLNLNYISIKKSQKTQKHLQGKK